MLTARGRSVVVFPIAIAALQLGCTDTTEPDGSATSGTGNDVAGQSSGGMSVLPSGGGGGGGATTAGMATGGANGGNGGATTAGSAGVGGMSGGAGGSGGAATATPSTGCGTSAPQALGSWVERPKLAVNGQDRQWWVWLPTGYDPMRAYPVIFTFHGCGGPGNFIPMEKQTGSDAIVVRGTGADDGCWTYGGEGDDVKFFDAMLAALQTGYCMDSSRVFAMGYSSGGWMTNTLECSRGDKLRATGTLSGGRAGNATNCKGKFARATVHDLNDPTNPFDTQGASKELDRVLAQNHCMTAVPPVPEQPAPCARYQGCDAGYPVIACRTEGKGHNRQDALAMDAFWRLFSSL